MIYFDGNKQAFGNKIPNAIATIDDETWAKYANTNAWDIADGEFKDISDTEEYKAKELADAKQTKLQEVYNANTTKYSDKDQTITINLPVTLTDGKIETQVENFKLLTVTSAGALLTVMTGLVMLATTMPISDTLATNEGLIIKGLNETVEGTKLINLIFAKLGEVIAQITVYQRTLETQINACTSIDELDKIEINFGQF